LDANSLRSGSALNAIQHKADDSLWAVNVGMGGPNGKLEAYTLGLSYKRAF